MKKLIYTIIFCIPFITINAQFINWEAETGNQGSRIFLNTGYAYSISTEIGYGYGINIVRPVLLSASFSVPMGAKVFDDYCLQSSAQVDLYQWNNLHVSGRLDAKFKRHETSFVVINSIASQTSLGLGYYKNRWFAMAEIGIDKNLATHLKHTDLMKENYPSIGSGWINPQGSMLNYGVQFGRSFGQHFEGIVQLNKINSVAGGMDPLLPYLVTLGFNWKWNNS